MVSSNDRVALITGATGLLGGVVADVFSAAGWRLGLMGTDRDRLAGVAEATGLAEDRWAPGVGDLTDRSTAEAAVAEVVGRLGRVDALLHLVGGYAGGGPIVDFADDDLRSMLDQHVWSTLNVARAAIPGMIERRWGRVVAVIASSVVTTPPKLAAYSVAKAAEETLLRTLAREVARDGVTVNVIAVRKIATDRERTQGSSPTAAAWTTPNEIASTMRHLCSDEAAAITGQRIALDGRA